MAYRWRAVCDPTLCALWAGNFSFISAKTYEVGIKKNPFDERVLLSIQNLGFGCLPSIVKLYLGIQKKCFDESTQNTCP